MKEKKDKSAGAAFREQHFGAENGLPVVDIIIRNIIYTQLDFSEILQEIVEFSR